MTKTFAILAFATFIGLSCRWSDADAQTLTVLYNFTSGSADGSEPATGLVQGNDGNFYGMASGGTNGDGTVFKITRQGTLTTLYQFGAQASDGVGPMAALVQGSDGNFYGTTPYGQMSPAAGTVFRISPAGALTNLYQFVVAGATGANPYGSLVQGSDSNFYGTTIGGGAYGLWEGTVFKITAQGTLTTLVQFPDGIAGFEPWAGLVQGNDSNFYGTTSEGGSTNCPVGCGTVFKMTSQGTLTMLWQFNGADGMSPRAALVQGTDSNFYGTTYWGGDTNCATYGCGTVFKITPQGTFTSLYQFGGLPTDGINPLAGLVQGSDGNFYGTTYGGGTNNQGTIFNISPQGTLTTLYQFGGLPTDGIDPEAGLVLGSDGSFYGTTEFGGTNYAGTVFKFSVGPPFQITSILVTNVHDLLITWNTTGVSNIVQVSPGVGASGSFSTNSFADVTNILVTRITTNFWDIGAATNRPTRYYRIRSPQ